ncbi:DUF7522 family protein [Haloglomus salinum]|jgi:hypothetical protein|uniref:DUF7522 family protein n=1 Tax=Haloglomus salinum TaxID=2962673 RepID=UPI0020C98EBD|nr:hypothetical protein [Haloglomus salinum]
MSLHEGDLIDGTRASELVSACRTTVGDQVRSVTYFTPDEFRQLYLRSDLDSDADLSGFVEHESLGFQANTAYRGSELGDYEYTIRVFENGFLCRITTADEGVFLTTDGLTLRDFDEVATAVGSILEEE